MLASAALVAAKSGNMKTFKRSSGAGKARFVRVWAGFFVGAILIPMAQATAPLVPLLEARGQAEFAEYRLAEPHRAFVIAPGGYWSWRAGMANEEVAIETALADCRRATEQPCMPYAINNQIVFDAKTWPQAWRPYLGRAEAAAAKVGTRRGERFPDLAFTAAGGRLSKLSDLRGKVVILHFWGSWCPPCQAEMPDLQKLFDVLRSERDVTFVVMPVREPLATATAWARRNRINLPLAFGGETTVKAGEFQLADGSRLADRQLARAFPTTYILDKHGIVLLARTGPVPRWPEYTPLLRDAIRQSGR